MTQAFKALFLLALLAGAGCSRKDVREPGDIQEHSVQLDRDLVERNALGDQWQVVRRHLEGIDSGTLSRNDRIYCLYWRGAAHFHLNQRDEARESWLAALEQHPGPSMRGQLQSGLRALGLGGIQVGISPEGHVLQVGIYGSRGKAEAIVNGLPPEVRGQAHVSETSYGGRGSWAVWIGPYPTTIEAVKVQQQLGLQKLQTIVKPASTYL